MSKQLNQNDQRRLTALIAAPLKDEGISVEHAVPVVDSAILEFANAYKRSLGIFIEVEQRDKIKADVLEKLG